jgi:hypothetical protein
MSVVAAGTVCIYFGYRLFYISQEKQGDLQLKIGSELDLKLRNVAPGVFFALFGAGILLYNSYRAITFELLENKAQNSAGYDQTTPQKAKVDRSSESPTGKKNAKNISPSDAKDNQASPVPHVDMKRERWTNAPSVDFKMERASQMVPP